MFEHMLAEKAFTLRGDVLEWVESMRLCGEPYGQYRFSPSRNYCDAYSSAIAAFLRDMFDELSHLGEKERLQWIELLCSFQDPDSGYFFDERLFPKDCNDLLSMFELTHACVSALDLLGSLPKNRLRFLDALANAPALIRWLDERVWVTRSGDSLVDRALLEGRLIFHLGGLLIYACEWGDVGHDVVELFFRWLDSNIDPSTGLFGTKQGCSLLNSMCASSYIYGLYFHQSRLVLYPDKVIDSVLSLQRQDGLFGSTPEANFSAAMLLVGMLMRCEHRQIEAEASLRRLQRSIISLELQNDDGGFHAGARLRGRHCHFGINWLCVDTNESDMLSTWLYCGALALISEAVESPLSRVGWFIRERNEAPTFSSWL